MFSVISDIVMISNIPQFSGQSVACAVKLEENRGESPKCLCVFQFGTYWDVLGKTMGFLLFGDPSWSHFREYHVHNHEEFLEFESMKKMDG